MKAFIFCQIASVPGYIQIVFIITLHYYDRVKISLETGKEQLMHPSLQSRYEKLQVGVISRHLLLSRATYFRTRFEPLQVSLRPIPYLNNCVVIDNDILGTLCIILLHMCKNENSQLK